MEITPMDLLKSSYECAGVAIANLKLFGLMGDEAIHDVVKIINHFKACQDEIRQFQLRLEEAQK